jgi:uncharacterized protein (DUF924 family)
MSVFKGMSDAAPPLMLDASARSAAVLSYWFESLDAASSLVTDVGRWQRPLDECLRASLGLLALVVLLDQFSCNTARGEAKSYAQNSAALVVAMLAIREDSRTGLALLNRMSLYVPLMHVENGTVRCFLERCVEELAHNACQACAHNQRYFDHALAFARRHAEVIETFSRCLRRNAILARPSTVGEQCLRGPIPGF